MSTDTKQQKPDAEPDRPTLIEALRMMDPDRRWLHPLCAVLWLFTIGAIPWWSGLWPWAMIPLGLVSTVIGVKAAKDHYRTDVYGDRQQRDAVIENVAAGLAGTAWLVYAGHHHPFHPMSLALLTLGGLVFGAFYASVRTKAPERQAAEQQQQSDGLGETQQRWSEEQTAELTALYETRLEAAGLGGVKVRAHPETRAGFKLVCQDRPSSPVTLEGAQGKAKDLAAAFAPGFEQQGISLESHNVWATRDKGTPAHLFDIHFSTKGVSKVSIPYPLGRPADSILKPINIGLFEDGEPIEFEALWNGIMCATTGGGKTVFGNNLIGSVTERYDASFWIGGCEKLVPLVMPWLAPWLLGRTERPVIEYVAGQDPVSVTEMLAEFYRAVKIYNDERLGIDSSREPSRDEPALFLLLDEASVLLEDNSDVVVQAPFRPKGEMWNASKLLSGISQVNRSSRGGVYLLTQFGIFDAMGPYGSKVFRNLRVRICGVTESHSDGRATLNKVTGVDTTKLDNNSLIVQPSKEAARVMPGKTYRLEGLELIAPVAERNTGIVSPGLPAWMQERMGQAYHERWSPERLPELVKAALQQLGVEWPAPPEPVVSPTVSADAERLDQDNDGGAPVDDEHQDHDHGESQAAPEAAVPEQRNARAKRAELYQIHEQMKATGKRLVDKLREQGTLGPLMSPTLDACLAAEQAGHVWVEAHELAWNAGLVPAETRDDLDEVGRITAAMVERFASEWDITAELLDDGRNGYATNTIIDTAYRYMTGQPRPATAPAAPEVAFSDAAQAATAATATAVVDDAAGSVLDELRGKLAAHELDEWLRASDLAVMLGRVDGAATEQARKAASAAVGRDLSRAGVKSFRTASGSQYRVGDLLEAANARQ